MSKLELEHIRECLLDAMNELDNLQYELEWFVSDSWLGLEDSLAIIDREISEQKQN